MRSSLLPRPLLVIGALVLGVAVSILASSASAVSSPRQAVQAAWEQGRGNGSFDALPYVFDLTGQYVIVPLLTVGDEVPLLQDSFDGFTPSPTQTFAMAGIPDGLGVYETADAYYVYMNHEIGASDVSKLSSTVPGKIKGGRVSLFQFTRDWKVVGGKNLIETALADGATYTLDLSSGNYKDASGNILNESTGPNLPRFCSGYLGATGFVDENGKPAPVWFAPQEVAAGRGWAVYPDGTAVALDHLGRYSKEQVFAASQYRADNSDTTVLISTEDNADGEVYLFMGQQTASDPNGFTDGDLYVLRVQDAQGNVFDYETIPTAAVMTGTWSLVPDNIALGGATTLSNWVNASQRSTNFRRPEDIHEDPNNPGTFYFATTGRNDVPPGGSEPDNAFGKLYRFSLNPSDPNAAMPFELLLVGGADTGVSYDNLTVDSHGRVLVQEDRAAGGADVMASQKRYARVIAYDIATTGVQMLLEANQGVVDPSVATDYGNWETSGIVEANANAIPGRSSYLLSVQAHSIANADYVRGGQLVLLVPTRFSIHLPLVVR